MLIVVHPCRVVCLELDDCVLKSWLGGSRLKLWHGWVCLKLQCNVPQSQELPMHFKNMLFCILTHIRYSIIWQILSNTSPFTVGVFQVGSTLYSHVASSYHPQFAGWIFKMSTYRFHPIQEGHAIDLMTRWFVIASFLLYKWINTLMPDQLLKYVEVMKYIMELLFQWGKL